MRMCCMMAVICAFDDPPAARLQGYLSETSDGHDAFQHLRPEGLCGCKENGRGSSTGQQSSPIKCIKSPHCLLPYIVAALVASKAATACAFACGIAMENAARLKWACGCGSPIGEMTVQRNAQYAAVTMQNALWLKKEWNFKYLKEAMMLEYRARFQMMLRGRNVCLKMEGLCERSERQGNGPSLGLGYRPQPEQGARLSKQD